MPWTVSEYFNNAPDIMQKIGNRILSRTLERTQHLEDVVKLWHPNEPHRGDDPIFYAGPKSLHLFETQAKIPNIEPTQDFPRSVNIFTAVDRFTTTLDDLVTNAINTALDPKKPDYKPQAVLLTYPRVDPSGEMGLFSNRASFLLVWKENVGISMLFAWDPDTQSAAIWAYLIAGVYIRNPETERSE